MKKRSERSEKEILELQLYPEGFYNWSGCPTLSGAGVSIRALELAFCCWQTEPLACIQALHQQGLVGTVSRRKLTPKAFPEWNAGVLLCWSHWMAALTFSLIIGCSVALVAVWPHSVWWLAMVLAPLYTAAFRGGCACDSRGTGPALGCLHAQLVLRSRVQAECF